MDLSRTSCLFFTLVIIYLESLSWPMEVCQGLGQGSLPGLPPKAFLDRDVWDWMMSGKGTLCLGAVGHPQMNINVNQSLQGEGFLKKPLVLKVYISKKCALISDPDFATGTDSVITDFYECPYWFKNPGQSFFWILECWAYSSPPLHSLHPQRQQRRVGERGTWLQQTSVSCLLSSL